MTSKMTLLISDENRLFREGVRRILASRKMEVAGEASSLVEVLRMLRTHAFDANLLLCDPSADIDREFRAMQEISEEFPDVSILVLTDRAGSSWLNKAVAAGAAGFLPKDISADALGFSLELVLLGEQIFPTLDSLLHAQPTAPAAPITVTNGGQRRKAVLSARETEILGCLVDGLPNKMIARNLNMTETTVKVHLKALLRKINARNRTQAAIWGMTNTPRAEPMHGMRSSLYPNSTQSFDGGYSQIQPEI
jgi:two-component system, NarL family, nitrate/nitrite response regulator NarL